MTKNIRSLGRIICLLSTLLLTGLRLEATHDLSSGIDAAAVAHNVLLSNPPLPMLYYNNRGDYRITAAPFIFSGELERTDNLLKGSGDFDGWGGGVAASLSMGNRWGGYFLLLGSNASGEFSYHNPSNPSVKLSEIRDMKATYVTISPGMVYQFFGEEEGEFSLPVFAGPLISISSIKQRYMDLDKQTFALETDADLEASLVNPGFLIGAQAGIPAGKYFKFNPFFIFGSLTQSDVTAKITTARVDTPGSDSGYLKRLRSGTKLAIPQKFATIGLNLFYKPWGINVNLTSPLVKKGFLDDEDAEMTTFTLSKSFGRYTK